jgi:gamma-glutamylcyclotransferase
MTNTTIRYFAYGSNMLSRRLRARVPSAKALGLATLSGYRLVWHKCSRDGSGKCDVVSTSDPADIVSGVVFEILAAEKPALDRAEGVSAGYAEKEVVVTMGSTLLTTLTYVATRTDATLCPYDWYKALVIAGAQEHGLPPEYIAALEIVQAKSDDDAERRAANRALLPLTSTDNTGVDDPLKPLADIDTADSRQVHFVETLPDAHAELAGMTLTMCTPKAVRQLFETAKNVSLYSFFVYPFHQVSESVAFQALEMALRARYKADETTAQTGSPHPSLRRLMDVAREQGWLKDRGFSVLPVLAARRIRDRRALDALEIMRCDSSIAEVRLSDEEPTKEEIEAEMAAMHFVEMLTKTLPDLRNGLAHGSTVLHPNSRYTLRVVCDAINQLYPA